MRVALGYFLCKLSTIAALFFLTVKEMSNLTEELGDQLITKRCIYQYIKSMVISHGFVCMLSLYKSSEDNISIQFGTY